MNDSMKLFIMQCVMLCLVLFAGWCNSRRRFIVDLKEDDRVVKFIKGMIVLGMVIAIIFTILSG